LTASNGLSQSSALIGKVVTVTNPDNTEQTITGKVTSANITNNGASIEINGMNFPLGLVTKISNSVE
jgi:hypothetical protein